MTPLKEHKIFLAGLFGILAAMYFASNKAKIFVATGTAIWSSLYLYQKNKLNTNEADKVASAATAAAPATADDSTKAEAPPATTIAEPSPTVTTTITPDEEPDEEADEEADEATLHAPRSASPPLPPPASPIDIMLHKRRESMSEKRFVMVGSEEKEGEEADTETPPATTTTTTTTTKTKAETDTATWAASAALFARRTAEARAKRALCPKPEDDEGAI